MKKSYLFIMLVVSAVCCGITSCKNAKKETSQQDASADSLNVVQDKTTDLAPHKSKNSTFSYTPTPPSNGKLKGVVELGASGFNMFLIEMDKDRNWVIHKKEFNNSLISEEMTSSEEVKKTLKEYISKLIDFRPESNDLRVSSRDIHFVVSSGAAKEQITERITKALKELGYFVNIVTPEQEAQYAFKCIAPKSFENSAFVVDIGSGNTKIAYMDQENIKTIETYGAKYFQKNINADVAYNDVKEKVLSIPKDKVRTCFIMGGVPYTLAKNSRLEKERYTVLDSNTATYDKLAQEEGQKVTCGLNIYKAILDASQCDQVIFDWDANFTIGFLLSLKY